ncbi:MAG TPA: hypothetical protein VIS95_01100 [Solirubrobacterales bacterium]
MPRPRLLALALALAAPTIVLSACGGEDAKLLPGGTAREITANLDTVQQLSDEGDCVGAESAARQVGEQIEAIEGVDRKLKEALEDGAARLEEVIAGCEEESAETTAPPVVPGDEDEDAGKDEKQEEKEREAEAKEREKAEKEAEQEEGDDEGTPEPSPQPGGEGKGPDEGGPPPAEETPDEGSSGGVSPGAPVGEGDE